MMDESAQKQVQIIPGLPQLGLFAARLLEWLNHDLNPHRDLLTESRAKALLLAANVLDEPTRHQFNRMATTEQGRRLLLYNLLRESGLSENEEVAALAMATAGRSGATEDSSVLSWLALSVAAFAWRSGFLLDNLDPAAPPEPYSPAGQLLKHAAHFIRQEVQRSATERDKLGRKLAYKADSGLALDSLRPSELAAPLPPFYRPPIPETYPEYNPGLELSADEASRQPLPESRGAISISYDDLAPLEPPASASTAIQPPLDIEVSPSRQANPLPATPPPHVVIPNPTATIRSGGPSKKKDRRKAKSTKLQIIVQERPDGPGLYGLQIRVSSRGSRRYVAGTTNKDGEFICELPVPVDSGMTYDVDVTWPRDYGSEVERKSITLNADRTHFTLPFYHTLKG